MSIACAIQNFLRNNFATVVTTKSIYINILREKQLTAYIQMKTKTIYSQKPFTSNQICIDIKVYF